MGAIDSESSRSALPRSQKGIDGNKKIKGVKRNIITDKDGDILEASTTPANIHDSIAIPPEKIIPAEYFCLFI
ncbi:MAG: transposase [Muribaculaceae bacterium]|nr:transposase [Muribaculaceae bacterium]MDE6772174.1 transposase [Muribaculaceae bacterium]